MTNPVNEMYERSPLIAISPITEMQSKYLIDLGKELISAMEKWDNTINNFQHVYHQYWLWVLGSYEVIRTMSSHQNKKKLNRKTQRKIFQYKDYITNIRIPFAKQKIATKKGEPEIKAFAELLVRGMQKDMTFEIKGIKYSAKDSIKKFDKVISDIELSDINLNNC